MKKLLAVLLATMLILSCVSFATAEETKTLTLLIHPTLYLAAGGDEPNGVVKLFEQEHNCTVEVVTATDAMSKAMLDFIAQGGTYDVINVNGPEYTDLNAPNFLVLDDYFANDEAYDFADLLPGPCGVCRWNDQQVGVPYRMSQNLIYYRTDLFEEAGLTIPDDWNNVYEVAKALSKDTDGDGKLDVYGYACAGKGEELAHGWLSVFYGLGGVFVDENGKAGFDSESGIRAAQLYADLYQDGLLPSDVFAWGRDDYITAMAQGRVAFGAFTGAYYGRFFDGLITPEQVGFAPLPNGGANRSNGWFLSVSKYSKNPDLAVELLKALTNKENGLREAVEWSNGPVRTSTYEAEEYKAMWPQAEALKISANYIVRDPALNNSSLMFETIAEELTFVMQGSKTAEQGMKDLAARVDELLAE